MYACHLALVALLPYTHTHTHKLHQKQALFNHIIKAIITTMITKHNHTHTHYNQQHNSNQSDVKHNVTVLLQ